MITPLHRGPNAETQVLLKIKRHPPRANPARGRIRPHVGPSMNIYWIRDMPKIRQSTTAKKPRPSPPTPTASKKSAAPLPHGHKRESNKGGSALVDQLKNQSPSTDDKFPIVRDLAVDRQLTFDSLKKREAWIPIDVQLQPRRRHRVPPKSRKRATRLPLA